jgi:hypothetical protein
MAAEKLIVKIPKIKITKTAKRNKVIILFRGLEGVSLSKKRCSEFNFDLKSLDHMRGIFFCCKGESLILQSLNLVAVSNEVDLNLCKVIA